MYQLIGMFLGFVSIMQLIEFLLWKHQICDNYHKALSISGMILNHLQPVVFGVLTWLIFRKNGIAIAVILAAYLSIIVPYSAQYLENKNLHCTTTRCNNPHLIWNWNTMEYGGIAYIIFVLTLIAISIVGIVPLKYGILTGAISVVTYGISHLLYDRYAVGALWCFWTAFIPVGILTYINLYN